MVFLLQKMIKTSTYTSNNQRGVRMATSSITKNFIFLEKRKNHSVLMPSDFFYIAYNFFLAAIN